MSAPNATFPRSLALWLSVAACAWVAFWTANGVAPWDGDRSNVWHQYEFLADGFLHGHTYLSVDPSPRLLALKDPYDPAANAPYRLWDASLYQGKYYLYYGPAPALVLMAPWQAMTGHVLPQRLAVAAFAAFGMAGLGLLLGSVRARHFPGLSAFALAGILIAAFHASWLPVTLRRPGIWELPIVSSTACLWWALYFLWKLHDSGGRARWAVALGISLSVLMGCRITFVFAAASIAALSIVRARGVSRREILRLAGPALALAGGVALLLYNHERYGRWLEFGQSYQLWGEDYRGTHFFNPALIPFNAWTYLFSWPRFGPYFPFLHPFWADPFPPGYMGFEEMYGVVFMMPIHLAGLAALAWAWRNRSSAASPALLIVLGAAAAASVFSAMVLFCWAGACSRYITELSAGWTVVTMIGMCVVLGSNASRRSARCLTSAAAFWTIACVWLASAEFRGFMKQTNPRTYAAVAHALDYPSKWWAESHGVRYGPLDLQLRITSVSGFGETVLLANGRPQRVNQLLVRSADGANASLVLAENEHPVLETPGIPAPGGRLNVRLDAPWLYPPSESPYWDGIADPAARLERKTLFSIRWGTGGAQAHSELSADATNFEPAVRGPDPSNPDLPSVMKFAEATPMP